MLLQELLDNKKILPVGRTWFNNDLLFMNFSGSGIRCNVSGNEVNITFFATKYDEDNSRPYITVFLNDNRYDYELDSEYKTITLHLKSGINELRVLKRTESNVSHAAIKEISGVKYHEIEEKKRLNIEFYGDSLTCGFGALATDPNLPFETKTESFFDAFAYKLSQKLDANYSAISVSGFPVYKSRWNQGFPLDSIADMISICSYHNDDTIETAPKWDNNNYRPDLVVIYLGTNDESYFSVGQDWVDELVKEVGSIEEARKHPRFVSELDLMYKRVLKFLNDLYKIYGKDLKVIYLLGMVDVIDFIYDTVSNAIKEFNNPNAVYFKLTGPKQGDVFGSVWHPGSQMHENTATELYEFVKNNIL